MITKRLGYRRGTARRAMSVEILSTDAQLYENHREFSTSSIL